MGALLRHLDLCQSTPWNDSSSTGPKSIRCGPRKSPRNEKKERARRRSDRRRERLSSSRGSCRCWLRCPDPHPPPPCYPPNPFDAETHRLKFIEGTYNMVAYLETFKATAQVGKWPCNQWAIILRSSLSDAGLTAIASMPADQQQDYATVKSELLREYHISCETYRRRIFETPFSTSHPNAWLAKH